MKKYWRQNGCDSTKVSADDNDDETTMKVPINNNNDGDYKDGSVKLTTK